MRETFNWISCSFPDNDPTISSAYLSLCAGQRISIVLHRFSNKIIMHTWPWFTEITMTNTCKALFKTSHRPYSIYSHSYLSLLLKVPALISSTLWASLCALHARKQVIYIILHEKNQGLHLSNLPKGLIASEWKGWVGFKLRFIWGESCQKPASWFHYRDKETQRSYGTCSKLPIS